MIVIIDYRVGNLKSVYNSLKRWGIPSKITSDIAEIEKANKIILPGVGNFANGIKSLKELNLIELLNEKVLIQGTPILGICLGAQLFTGWSAEGEIEGLGWFDAKTVRFNFSNHNDRLKVPHIGWNTLEKKKPNPILNKIDFEADFYFVHSYHIVCNHNDDILTITHYGYDFVSAIQRDNIYGIQFHPEKSHNQGAQILKNFAGL